MDTNGKTRTHTSGSARAAVVPDGVIEREGAPDRAPPLPGSVLNGKYRIDGELGRGGMSVVMAGHQLGLDRPVAIKFLRRGLAGRPGSTRRFLREAMAVARMQSEHIVRVIDSGEADGVPFIVMERLDGSDLAAVLTKGPLPVDDAVAIVREAAEAIAEAHALGIVHRDVKPSNLFLTTVRGQRVVKVLDFGVSKWLGIVPDGDTPFATRGGVIVGTPAYASPEQLKKPETVDARTDVWALGVVLYQCVSGRLPFKTESFAELCAAILENAPAPFDSSLGIPSNLGGIVERCLRRDPGERYQSARELERALANHRAGKASTGVPAARRSRRTWWLVAILGISLVLLVVVVKTGARTPDALANPTLDVQPVLPARVVDVPTPEQRAPGPESEPAVTTAEPEAAPTTNKRMTSRSGGASATTAAPPSSASAPADPEAVPRIDPKLLYRR